MINNPNKAAFPKEYQAWKGMRKRCRNNRCKDFKNYGKRGITICKRWEIFNNFLSDLGPKPTTKHSLERTNNSGNYDPSNCRWATRLEQNRNKRNILMVKYKGETLPSFLLEDRLGLSRRRIHDRLRKGWTMQEAIETPQRRSPRPPVTP